MYSAQGLISDLFDRNIRTINSDVKKAHLFLFKGLNSFFRSNHGAINYQQKQNSPIHNDCKGNAVF